MTSYRPIPATRLALAVAILSVLSQAMRGRLPTHITTAGVAYDADVTGAVESATEQLQSQISVLQANLERVGEVVFGEDEPRR
jgi:hypothetical protein